ncbi:MAG: AAA family ATPase, partial [Pseudomonadota bacterium]
MFYEMLIGQPPFESDDALGLIHAHLALRPLPPDGLNPSIPSALSDVVLKLLSKNAEDRYQSAYGLKADLLAIQEKIDTEFAPGQKDISDTFCLPQKLYGRKVEAAQVIAAVNRIAEGGGELLLIIGPAGIGKTSLIRGCRQPLTTARGNFGEGKFDQLQQATPYLALKQALNAMVRQLLASESDEALAAWRQRLEDEFGQNTGVLLDIAPELEKVIGPQPDASELPAMQTRNRLLWIFRQALQMFCRPESPLVIFLDDLQWADAASLDLLATVVINVKYLLVIGAYRDNEVDEAHLLRHTLDQLHSSGATITEVNLAPLALADVEAIVSEALPSKIPHTPLAQLIYSKTGGNPFFIAVFLENLYTEGLLNFDHKVASWTWNEAEIRAQNITDNVAELMTSKLSQLPDNAREALKIAACIGNRFRIEDLKIAALDNDINWPGAVQASLHAGLIMPLEQVDADYRFAHDRIQQSARNLLSDEARKQLHWQIGQYLWAQLGEQAIDEQVQFTIANHLNEGCPADLSVIDSNTALQLARLNLKAGSVAAKSSAHDIAMRYFTAGFETLPQNSWQTHRDLTRELCLEAAEVALLQGDDSHVQHYTKMLLAHADQPFQKVQAYDILMRASIRQGEMDKGFEFGRQAAALLGVNTPRKITLWSRLRTWWGALQLQWSVQGRIKTAKSAPRHIIPTPKQEAASRLFYTLDLLTFAISPSLLANLVFSKRDYMAKPTPVDWSYALAGQGMLISLIRHDFKTGYRLAKAGLEVFESQPDRTQVAKIYAIVYGMCHTWGACLEESLEPLRRSALESFQYGVYSDALMNFSTYCNGLYICSKPLEFIREEMQLNADLMRQFQHFQSKARIISRYQLIVKLLGVSSSAESFDGEDYDSVALIKECKKIGDRDGLYFIYYYSLVFHHLFNRQKLALKYADLADEEVRGGVMPMYEFHCGLIRIDALQGSSAHEQKQLHKKIHAHLAMLKKLAAGAPMNWLPKYLLVKAEYYRAQGQQRQAIEHYKRCLEEAEKNGFTNDCAIANELIARFYLSIDDTVNARHYMQASSDAWRQWGALAKVQDLETNYPTLLNIPKPAEQRITSDHLLSVSTSTSSTEYGSVELDFFSILKASQILSEEIVMQRLLERLMNAVIENAGAQRASLLMLDETGELRIEASQDIDSGKVEVLQGVLPSSNQLPVNLVRYVARTREAVMIEQFDELSDFQADQYFENHQPKSVLCLPVVYKGELRGVLYLENRLNSGVFTSRRQEALQILAAQAAVAIENAQLYQNLEQKVAKRTEELQKARQEALDAVESKALFLANMSHEIRTPMNSVVGMSGLLNETELSQEQQEYVQSIQTSGETLLTIVNDILDF